MNPNKNLNSLFLLVPRCSRLNRLLFYFSSESLCETKFFRSFKRSTTDEKSLTLKTVFISPLSLMLMETFPINFPRLIRAFCKPVKSFYVCRGKKSQSMKRVAKVSSREKYVPANDATRGNCLTSDAHKFFITFSSSCSSCR